MVGASDTAPSGRHKLSHRAPVSRRAEAAPTKRAAPATGIPAPQKIGILIANRSGIFRLGLTRLFASEDDLQVVAETPEPGEIVQKALDFKPDVAFVQVEMLKAAGQATLGAIRLSSALTKVVVTAAALDEAETMELMKAGARGMILNSAEPALFIKCARKVGEGEIWLPKKHVAAMARELSASAESVRPVDTLTFRERLVISCLVQGWRNREIAGHLAINEQTVKNHLRSIYDKVGVSDRVELVLYAFHRQMDLPPVDGCPEHEPVRKADGQTEKSNNRMIWSATSDGLRPSVKTR